MNLNFLKFPKKKEVEDLEKAFNLGWLTEEEMLRIEHDRIEKRLIQISKKYEKSLTRKRA